MSLIGSGSIIFRRSRNAGRQSEDRLCSKPNPEREGQTSDFLRQRAAAGCGSRKSVRAAVSPLRVR